MNDSAAEETRQDKTEADGDLQSQYSKPGTCTVCDIHMLLHSLSPKNRLCSWFSLFLCVSVCVCRPGCYREIPGIL